MAIIAVIERTTRTAFTCAWLDLLLYVLGKYGYVRILLNDCAKILIAETARYDGRVQNVIPPIGRGLVWFGMVDETAEK